jgi:chromosome partitioning protein
MRRIAFVCGKGGTTKTTSATTLAVALANRGHKTLLVDADQQANATWVLTEGQGSSSPTLATVLTRDALAVEAIRPTKVKGLDLLPADSSLGGVNVALAQELGRDTRLRSAMVPIEGQYEFVLIDTGPAFNTILANVLVYAIEVIVPLDVGVYALLGLVQLQEMIAEVREAYGNDALRIAGLLLAKVSKNNVARDVEAELRSRFGDLVFKSTIPLSVKVEEAASRGATIMEHAPKSPAAIAYDRVVLEIINHGQSNKRGRGSAVRGSREIDAA